MRSCIKKPLVSIVIPTYNREDFVKEAIESALSQTYSNIEVVVVDNCSTDKTWDIICGINSSKIQAYRNDSNIGPVLNWKKGVELSNGEYVKLLFSDDKISENYVEKCIDIFDKNTAFVLSPIQYLTSSGYRKAILYGKEQFSKDEYFKSFACQYSEIFPVSPGAALFRKKDIEKAFITEIPTMGELDPMRNGAGIDLLIYFSIANNYEKIRISKESKAIFRLHNECFSVLDRKIYHYYYRAIIYFLPYLRRGIYKDLFKIYLSKNAKKDSSFLKEYEMVHVPNFQLRHIFLMPYFYIFKYWGKFRRRMSMLN
jgi:glycosyltransferase involved in cell wall biosynthesis